MATNVKKIIAAGAEIVYYGTIDGSGYLIGGTTTAPTAGDQDGNPALQLEGVKDFPFSPGEPERVTITGDDKALGQFLFKPTQFPQDNLTFGAADLTFSALAQGTKVRDVGGLSLNAIQPSDPDWPDLCMLVGSQAKSRASGSVGVSHWDYLLIPRIQVNPMGRSGFNERGDAQYTYAMNVNPVDTHIWGEALSDTNEGTTEVAAFQITSPYRLHMHRFTGDGTETDFNLDYTPASEDGDTCLVWVAGTLQTYGTGDDYEVTASTKVLDFKAAPADGAKIVVLYGYTLS